MQNRYRPVILTRPGAANDRLADLLEADGLTVWRWPAFTITLPEDQALVAERFAHLDDVEMVVMASPAAVAAVRTGCASGRNTSRLRPWAKGRQKSSALLGEMT